MLQPELWVQLGTHRDRQLGRAPALDEVDDPVAPRPVPDEHHILSVREVLLASLLHRGIHAGGKPVGAAIHERDEELLDTRVSRNGSGQWLPQSEYVRPEHEVPLEGQGVRPLELILAESRRRPHQHGHWPGVWPVREPLRCVGQIAEELHRPKAVGGRHRILDGLRDEASLGGIGAHPPLGQSPGNCHVRTHSRAHEGV
mmetsp:Transcript_51198/g.163697  ORF Transcript_51198/g.163697 Transcript_51198/m.163697 type:complete len:200 (+) Transcript_51198:305-904(+)